MIDDLNYFKTTMPNSRPADYYLGCLEGSVFMDFDNCENGLIHLKRISFDGYGCCNLESKAIPMNEFDSQQFKEIMELQLPDQSRLSILIKKTLSVNKDLIWEDALKKYGLI